MGRIRVLMTLARLVLLAACGNPSAPSTSGCVGPYPDQASSPYVLPWRVGETYRIGQGNCGPGSHAAGTAVQYAYDVLMPMATPIIASRSGRVLLVEERFPDATRIPGQENYINVTHPDGTIAGYVHLTKDGALVEVGDVVVQGQVIALSGDSGSSTEPHIHFHVQGCEGCSTVPVTFRNTRPHPQGLVQGESYTAEPF